MFLVDTANVYSTFTDKRLIYGTPNNFFKYITYEIIDNTINDTPTRITIEIFSLYENTTVLSNP